MPLPAEWNLLGGGAGPRSCSQTLSPQPPGAESKLATQNLGWKGSSLGFLETQREAPGAPEGGTCITWTNSQSLAGSTRASCPSPLPPVPSPVPRPPSPAPSPQPLLPSLCNPGLGVGVLQSNQLSSTWAHVVHSCPLGHGSLVSAEAPGKPQDEEKWKHV